MAGQTGASTPRRRLGDGGITVRYTTTDAHASPEARGWRHHSPLPNDRYPRLAGGSGMEASKSATQRPIPTPRRRLGDGGITVRYPTIDTHASPEARGWRHRIPLANDRCSRLAGSSGMEASKR